MPESQNKSNEYTPNSVLISFFSEELFDEYKDKDSRIHLANHILYGDSVRNDIESNLVDEEGLRKALPGDIFAYSLIPDPATMKLSVEANLANISRLRKQKGNPIGIRRVWVFCYDIAEEDADKEGIFPSFVIYKDPNAQDINKIIKEKRIILGLFTVIEFEPGKYMIEGKETKEERGRIEWTFLSPGDSRNEDIYLRYIKKKEREALENLFFLDFS